uniref:Uncharacterized protein n=1 Tax=Panagrolaimus sp. PS1159 TaxID=55785 RepID=A0AC35EQY6_9BILA
MLVYRVTLKRRYQIFVNLKVLKYLWPSIVMFSIIAPLGPIVAAIYTLLTPYKLAPLAVFHLFYLIAFLAIMSYRLYSERKTAIKTENASSSKLVSPWGKSMPANVSVDKYFDGLNEQWN